MLKKIKKFFSRKERDDAKIATRHEVKPRPIDRVTGLSGYRQAQADSDNFTQQVAIMTVLDSFSSPCESGSSHSHHHSDSSCSSYDSGSSSSYDSGSSGGSSD